MLKLFANGSVCQDVKVFNFKGGEVQVKVTPKDLFVDWGTYDVRSLQIWAEIRNSDDIMGLLMLTDAARRQFPGAPVSLEMPYIPYARQDRVCAPGEALSLKVFTDLINSQNYQRVKVWDPHSDVATALLNNCLVIKQYVFAERAIRRASVDNNLVGKQFTLVSPDAGALKKISELQTALKLPVVRADKTRDVMTGAITGTVVYTEHVGDSNFFIVDDICDGGRTFIELAKVLRPLTNGKIFLYVTHGIFSYGFDELRKHIDQIYTANSFVDLKEVSDFVKQVDL